MEDTGKKSKSAEASESLYVVSNAFSSGGLYLVTTGPSSSLIGIIIIYGIAIALEFIVTLQLFAEVRHLSK